MPSCVLTTPVVLREVDSVINYLGPKTVQVFKRVGDTLRDSNRCDAQPEGNVVNAPADGVDLALGEVVYRMHNRAACNRQYVAQHIRMGVDDMWTELVDHPSKPAKHSNIQTGTFTQPVYWSGDFRFEVARACVEQGRDRRLKSVSI